MICQTHSGTNIGAVKFYDILPWEVDADIKLHMDNYTAFGEIVIPDLVKLGFNCVSTIKKSTNELIYTKFPSVTGTLIL